MFLRAAISAICFKGPRREGRSRAFPVVDKLVTITHDVSGSWRAERDIPSGNCTQLERRRIQEIINIIYGLCLKRVEQ